MLAALTALRMLIGMVLLLVCSTAIALVLAILTVLAVLTIGAVALFGARLVVNTSTLSSILFEISTARAVTSSLRFNPSQNSVAHFAALL